MKQGWLYRWQQHFLHHASDFRWSSEGLGAFQPGLRWCRPSDPYSIIRTTSCFNQPDKSWRSEPKTCLWMVRTFSPVGEHRCHLQIGLRSRAGRLAFGSILTYTATKMVTGRKDCPLLTFRRRHQQNFSCFLKENNRMCSGCNLVCAWILKQYFPPTNPHKCFRMDCRTRRARLCEPENT